MSNLTLKYRASYIAIMAEVFDTFFAFKNTVVYTKMFIKY